MAARGAGDLLPGITVSQVFRAGRSHLSAVSPILGTYRKIQTCHLALSLYKLRGRPGAWFLSALAKLDLADRFLAARRFPSITRVATAIARRLLLSTATREADAAVDCAAVYDNAPVTIFSKADSGSADAYYLLRIESPDASPGNASTVWLSDEEHRIEGHVWCAVGGVRIGDLGLRAHLGYANPVSESPVPPGLLISTTTQCNLNCVHCISRWSRDALSRLSPDIRATIKSWYARGLTRFAATDYSGDTLWAEHRFGGELDFFIGLDTPMHVDTNGAHLTRDASRRLMRSRIKSINVSLDAARDETFRRVRKGAPPLPDILSNMAALAQERARAGRTDVRLSVSFALMRSTIGELGEAIRIVKDAGFDVLFAPHVEAYTADMVEESFWFDQAGFNAAREAALATAAALGVALQIPPAFEDRPVRAGHSHCDEPWRSAMILGSGEVYACCIPGPDMRMGNLTEQTMEEIWNGARYQSLRRKVNSAEPPAACNNCPRHRVLNNRGSYVPYEFLSKAAPAPRPTAAVLP